MKKYVFKKKYYNLRVVFVGYFVVAIFAYALYRFYQERNALWAMIMVVCVYQFINTFLSLSNPEEVHIDDHRITFKGFGKEHTYDFKQIKDFRVKAWPDTHRCYVRINKDTTDLLHGRYWVNCMYFNDTKELYDWFLDKEAEIHPETVKAYARKQYKMSPEEKEKLIAERKANKKSWFKKKG